MNQFNHRFGRHHSKMLIKQNLPWWKNQVSLVFGTREMICCWSYRLVCQVEIHFVSLNSWLSNQNRQRVRDKQIYRLTKGSFCFFGSLISFHIHFFLSFSFSSASLSGFGISFLSASVCLSICLFLSASIFRAKREVTVVMCAVWINMESMLSALLCGNSDCWLSTAVTHGLIRNATITPFRHHSHTYEYKRMVQLAQSLRNSLQDILNGQNKTDEKIRSFCSLVCWFVSGVSPEIPQKK